MRQVLCWFAFSLVLCACLCDETSARCGRGLLGVRGRVQDRLAAKRGVFGVRGLVRDNLYASLQNETAFDQVVEQTSEVEVRTYLTSTQVRAIPGW